MSASVERRLLDLVEALYGCVHLDEYFDGLLDALPRAVPADWVSLNEFGEDGHPVRAVVVPDLEPWAYEAFARYGHQNPLVVRKVEGHDGGPTRMSDVIAPDEWHELDVYREFYGPIGLEYQIAFSIAHTSPRWLGIALSRRSTDFSDVERELLERARPFLIQGYRNAVDRDAAEVSGSVHAMEAALRSRGLTEREAEALRTVAFGL